MKPRLLILASDSDRPLDITQAIRADIARRDWSACHIAGDRNPPVDLPDKRRWGWR